MTRDEAIALVVSSLPYPAQIKEWDTVTEEEALRFTWRGTRFRFSFAHSWLVEEVEDSVLIGSDLALMIEHAINLTYIHQPIHNRRP